MLAIAPIILGSYELRGVTPLWPARLSQAAGIGAIRFSSVAQVLLLAGVGIFGDDRPASGAISGLGFVVFGLGLLRGGANDPLTDVGGVGHAVLFPIWAFLFGRLRGMRNRRA